MVIIFESKKSLADICAAMEPTVRKHNFGVLGVHNLKEAMAKKGVAFDRECIIFEVCNPVQAKRVLESRMEIATALPCRIAVYSSGETVKIATLKPTMLLAAFGAPELDSVAREVEQTISSIMQDVAG